MKRSTCASGRAYVPSVSIGFCVAMTRKGSGTLCVSRPIVTCRSCMTSRSALCTFAGEEEVREHGAERCLEVAEALVVDARTDEVGRHQVGRELDALEVAGDRLGDRL